VESSGKRPKRGSGSSGEITPLVAVVNLLLTILLAIGMVHVIQGEDDDRPNNDLDFTLRMAPAEFLYLDGPRILAYLEQLEGGAVKEIHRISKEIKKASAELAAGPGKLGVGSDSERVADSILTRTEASELGLLLSALKNDHEGGVEVHPVKMRKPADLEEIREGWLVRFTTHDMVSPGYVRPYVVLHRSATARALFPSNTKKVKQQRRKAKQFSKRVGQDPRITLAVFRSRGKSRPMKVLLPAHYLGLTRERSLLERDHDHRIGGRVVVIGKVIRKFEADEGPIADPEYVDFATRETWRSPLRRSSNFLINHVSHNCRIGPPAKKTAKRKNGEHPEIGIGSSAKAPIFGRECFLTKLKRQTRLDAPGAVILPLAVFK
jgi:hypothetical protein